MPADTEQNEEQKNKKIGLAILAVVLAAIAGANAFFWIRWQSSAAVNSKLVDHQCKLTQKGYQHYLLGRASWSIPLTGPSWTDVPCDVHLSVKDSDGVFKPMADVDSSFDDKGQTRTTFEIPQTMIGPSFQQARCHVQVEKFFAMTDGFNCCFAPGDPDNHGVFAKHVAERPNLTKLLLMKAVGFSFCTLFPFLFCAVSLIKGKLSKSAEARDISKAVAPTDDAGDYSALPDGI